MCLIYLFYLLLGASLFQEIEFKENNSSLKAYVQQERERLLIKIIEKRQLFNLEQYTKYVYKHIRLYEEGLKQQLAQDEDSSLNFSKSFFFLTKTLTTLGSTESFPKSKLGKCFLMIYTSIGIPLTLILVRNISYSIESIIFSKSSFFSSKILRFIFAKELKMNFNILKLIFIFLIYIYLGSYFSNSKQLFENFYRNFMTIFTIQSTRHESIIYFIYLIFGFALVFSCMKTIQKHIESILINCGKNLHENLTELIHQMGLDNFTHEESLSSRPQYLIRAISLDQPSTHRPIGIAEPLRRLSNGFIRAFKGSDSAEVQHADKSVQVTTIIRRCGRCAENNLLIRTSRQHSATSLTSSPDDISTYDDDDIMDTPPPSFDRIRQRRATQVAKTIINQLATQPRSSSIENLLPIVNFQDTRELSVTPDLPRKRTNQIEFSQISQQISSLLTHSDDDNDCL